MSLRATGMLDSPALAGEFIHAFPRMKAAGLDLPLENLLLALLSVDQGVIEPISAKPSSQPP